MVGLALAVHSPASVKNLIGCSLSALMATESKFPIIYLTPPDPPPDSEPFILDTLHDRALQLCHNNKSAAGAINVVQYRPPGTDSISVDQETLEFLLSNPSPFSDFELAKSTLTWSRKNRVPFEEFWRYFDASQLSMEEQTWMLSELPPSPKYPAYFKNGLLQSSIVTQEDLQAFRLDYHRLHWKCVFSSQSDPLQKLLATVNQTFSRFAKKLLIFRLGERLSVAVYFPKPIEQEEDCVVNETIRLFAFPHSHKDRVGHRRVVPTKKNYRFYYDESVMQLYENHRQNTFVFFTKSANDDSAFRNVQGRSDRARARQKTIEDGINCEWRVSIALAKFNSELARHVGRTNREPVTEAVSYLPCPRNAQSD